MARPPGSKNKTPQELKIEAEILKKKAENMELERKRKALAEQKTRWEEWQISTRVYAHSAGILLRQNWSRTTTFDVMFVSALRAMKNF